MPDVRWRGLEHQTLYDWINTGPGPTASTPQLDYWGGLKQSLADISAKLNTTLGDLGATWEGVAGASATTGLTPLQMWAEEAQSSAEVMASSAQDQADHVATARAAMPEPQKVPTAAPTAWQLHEAAEAAKHGKKGPAHAVAQQAADHEEQETAAADAHERAIQVMSNYQANSENNAATLGVFGTPPDIVVAVEMPHGTGNATVGYPGASAMPQHHGGGPQLHHGSDLSVNPAAAVQPAGPTAVPASAPAAAAGASGPTMSPAAGLGGAAAAMGGAGALAGFARPSLLSGSGAMMGVAGGARGGRNEEQTKAASKSTQGTAPSMNQPPRVAGEPATPPPPPPPGAGAAGMGGAGHAESVRGGNPYLSASPTTGAVDGEGGLRRFAGGVTGATGGIGQGGAPEFGPNPGGAGGAHGGMPGGQPHQLGHAGPPPMAPNAGQAGGGQGYDETYEGSSYLVETDSVFDDGRMVAPPVLGGDD